MADNDTKHIINNTEALNNLRADVNKNYTVVNGHLQKLETFFNDTAHDYIEKENDFREESNKRIIKQDKESVTIQKKRRETEARLKAREKTLNAEKETQRKNKQTVTRTSQRKRYSKNFNESNRSAIEAINQRIYGDFGTNWQLVPEESSIIGKFKIIAERAKQDRALLEKELFEGYKNKFLVPFRSLRESLLGIKGSIEFFVSLAAKPAKSFLNSIHKLRLNIEKDRKATEDAFLTYTKNAFLSPFKYIKNSFNNAIKGIKTTYTNIKTSVSNVWKDFKAVGSFAGGLLKRGFNTLLGKETKYAPPAKPLADSINDITDNNNTNTATEIPNTVKVPNTDNVIIFKNKALQVEKETSENQSVFQANPFNTSTEVVSDIDNVNKEKKENNYRETVLKYLKIIADNYTGKAANIVNPVNILNSDGGSGAIGGSLLGAGAASILNKIRNAHTARKSLKNTEKLAEARTRAASLPKSSEATAEVQVQRRNSAKELKSLRRQRDKLSVKQAKGTSLNIVNKNVSIVDRAKNLGSSISKGANYIKDTAGSVGTQIATKVSGGASRFFSGVSNFASGIWNKGVAATNYVKGSLTKFAKWVGKSVKGVCSALKAFKFFEKLKGVFQSLFKVVSKPAVMKSLRFLPVLGVIVTLAEVIYYIYKKEYVMAGVVLLVYGSTTVISSIAHLIPGGSVIALALNALVLTLDILFRDKIREACSKFQNNISGSNQAKTPEGTLTEEQAQQLEASDNEVGDPPYGGKELKNLIDKTLTAAEKIEAGENPPEISNTLPLQEAAVPSMTTVLGTEGNINNNIPGTVTKTDISKSSIPSMTTVLGTPDNNINNNIPGTVTKIDISKSSIPSMTTVLGTSDNDLIYSDNQVAKISQVKQPELENLDSNVSAVNNMKTADFTALKEKTSRQNNIDNSISDLNKNQQSNNTQIQLQNQYLKMLVDKMTELIQKTETKQVVPAFFQQNKSNMYSSQQYSMVGI